jgi:hypothetical protein
MVKVEVITKLVVIKLVVQAEVLVDSITMVKVDLQVLVKVNWEQLAKIMELSHQLLLIH